MCMSGIHYLPEEEEEVKLSPDQVNQYLVNQYRQKMQSMHYNERLNRHGY